MTWMFWGVPKNDFGNPYTISKPQLCLLVHNPMNIHELYRFISDYIYICIQYIQYIQYMFHDIQKNMATPSYPQ